MHKLQSKNIKSTVVAPQHKYIMQYPEATPPIGACSSSRQGLGEFQRAALLSYSPNMPYSAQHLRRRI